MTTAQAMTAPPARMTDDEPRARFRDLLAAEWLKTWSLRSTSWMYAITALAVIGFNAGTAYDHYKYWYQYDDRGRATFIANGSPLMDAFTGNAAMVLVLAVAAIGAVSITGEYGTGLIRTTFTAVPARRSVMAAKALVLTAVTTLFGALVALASFVSTQAILSGRDASVTLGHPGALRLVVASALLAPVAALAGLAIGAVIRHTGGAVIGCVVVLLLLPMVLSDHAASHGGAPAHVALQCVGAAVGLGSPCARALPVDGLRSLDGLCRLGPAGGCGRDGGGAPPGPVTSCPTRLPCNVFQKHAGNSCDTS